MRTRIILGAGALLMLSGCALPPRVAESMVDSKLCPVRAQPLFFGFRNDERTTQVIDAELERREMTCPQG